MFLSVFGYWDLNWLIWKVYSVMFLIEIGLYVGEGRVDSEEDKLGLEWICSYWL